MSLQNEQGTFGWFSLNTTDPQKANLFYQDLFDCQSAPMEIPNMGTSHVLTAENLTYADIFPLDGDKEQNRPSYWSSYIAVENVDETLKKVEELGGKIIGQAYDIPQIGRTAIIADPVGTFFNIFTPFNQEDTLKRTGDEKGQICWLELMLDDPSLVTSFYAELFNWKLHGPEKMENGGEYISFDINGDKIGGFFKRPKNVPATPPMWMTYFTVPNIVEYTEKAKQFGATILVNNQEIPETGFFSIIQDPTGAMLYIFEYTGNE